MFDRTHPRFVDFIRESNRVEGILRDPTEDEIATHERLLKLVQLHPTTVGDFQTVIAPGKPLRERPGMNVRVGNHIAPEGGPGIIRRLCSLRDGFRYRFRSGKIILMAFISSPGLSSRRSSTRPRELNLPWVRERCS